MPIPGIRTIYAALRKNLAIARVPSRIDVNHKRGGRALLTAGYDLMDGASGTNLTVSQAFPSGHTTAAYAYGLAMAEILPELGPEILTRASEAGNNRAVLGVHYPMDIMGGRIEATATCPPR
ncbi:acid phosphatase [Cutibacterium acnes JCM 18918]|nr:acid phosphatase [Cutibacterium acnes JCM 18918]